MRRLASCAARRRGIHAILRSAAAGLVLAGTIVVLPQSAQAKELKNFVTDLFGGQGLQLNDPAEGVENVSISQATIQSFGAINSSISSSLGPSSLSSAVSGSIFDITQGMPVASTESLGPLVGERAETLGQGHFDFGIGYSHTTFKRLNNVPLSSIAATLTPRACSPIGVEGCDDEILLNLNLKLERDAVTFAAAYGVTPSWDVGVIVPLLHVHASASATATLNDLLNDGDQFLPNARTTLQTNGRVAVSTPTGGDANGVGDVILRSKYNLIRDPGDLADFAIYNEVKAPTGDQNNFLGSGNTDVLAEIVVSKQLGAVAPHLNLGYQYAIGTGSDRSNLRYVVGADVRVTPVITLAGDFVGERSDAGLHIVDLATGLKWSIFGQQIVTVGVLVPVNASEGLRSDLSGAIRWEIGF